MSDTTLRRAEGLILIALLVSYVLAFVTRRLRSTRPDFRIGRPVIVGFGLRLMAVVASTRPACRPSSAEATRRRS